jgi:hypothetical protein
MPMLGSEISEFPGADVVTSAPQDNLTHLRPCSTLEMLDRVFAVYRARPVLFTSLGFLYALPSFALTIGMAFYYGPGLTPEEIARRITPWAAAALLLAQWPNAATISAAFQTLLFPRRSLAFGTAIRGSLSRLPPLILTRLAIMAMIVMIGFGLPVELRRSQSAGVLQQGLAIWLILLAVFMTMSWALVPAVVMIERRWFVDAMARGFQLMRMKYSPGVAGDGAMRRLLVLALFPICAWLACRLPIEAVCLAQYGKLSVDAPANDMLIIADACATLLVTAFLEPWIYIALVVLYCECRMRREGFDIQMRLLSHQETGAPMQDWQNE